MLPGEPHWLLLPALRLGATKMPLKTQNGTPRTMKTTAHHRTPLEALTQIAEREPYRFFNQTELAQILHLDRAVIREVQHGGAPFFKGKSRPEWILEWIRDQWLSPAFQAGKKSGASRTKEILSRHATVSPAIPTVREKTGSGGF